MLAAFGPWIGQLGEVVAPVHRLHPRGVLGHPGEVLLPVAGVDADEDVLGREAVGHHVVHEAALVVQEARVDRLPVVGLAEVVGDERVGALQRPLAAELDLPHVRDVEQTGGVPHRLVLGHHPGVLDRHVPAGEVDHPRPERAVSLVERCLLGHGGVGRTTPPHRGRSRLSKGGARTPP